MNYGIYLARVVGVASASEAIEGSDTKADSRLLVRVLPQMEGVSDDMLPMYPPFFRDEAYSGVVDELVWVICSNDFQIGYILGPANYTTYSDNESFNKIGNVNLSPSAGLKQKINASRVKLLGEGIDWTNTKVDFWSNGCMHFTCKNNGTKIIAYANGTLYEFASDGVLFIVGNSVMKIDANGINIKSEGTIGIQSEDVALGTSGDRRHVMVSGGTSSETAGVSSSVRA